MVYSGTEFLTSDDDVLALNDLLKYLEKNINIKDIKDLLKIIADLQQKLIALQKEQAQKQNEITQDIRKRENMDIVMYPKNVLDENLVKPLGKINDSVLGIAETRKALKDAVEKLIANIDSLSGKQSIEFLQAIEKTKLETAQSLASAVKRIDTLEKNKPTSTTTIIEQKLDDKRIDALEKQQKEVLAIIDGVIDNAADELKEVQEKLIKELEKRIKEKNKKVIITGGVSAGKDNLRELLDVSLTSLSNNDILQYNSATQKWENAPNSGGGGSPAGSDTQIQYNNSGAFGANANFTYDGNTFSVIDAPITKNPTPPTSGSVTFVSNAGGITANGSNGQYYLYSVYDDGSGGVAYDALGFFTSATDPNDFNPYNIDITWSGEIDANAMAILDFVNSQYVIVPNTGAATLDASTSWTAGSPPSSPTTLNSIGNPLWLQNTVDYSIYDFGVARLGLNGSDYLQLKWQYTGAGGLGALRFEDSLNNLRYINANLYSENIYCSNQVTAGSFSGYVYPTTFGANYIAYGGSGGYVTGTANFSYNATTGQTLISNSAITAQSQMHIHRNSASDVMTRYTNSASGTTSTDGLTVGLLSTGAADIRLYETAAMTFYTQNISRAQIPSGGVTQFNVFGQVRAAYSSIATTSTDGLVNENQASATSGVPIQRSPRLRWSGHVWDGTATRIEDWIVEPAAQTSGASPTSVFAFGRQYNAGGYTYHMNLSSAGNLSVGNGTTAASARIHATSTVAEIMRAQRTTANNAAYAAVNSSGSTFFGLVSAGDAFSIGSTADVTADSRFYVNNNGNIGVNTTTQFGSGVKVVGIANATTVPTTNPTGGGVLYVEAGALKYRGSSGTVTTIAAA